MGVGETLMKLVVKVSDAVALAHRFRESPGLAMNELVGHVRGVFVETLEQVMNAELELHLAESGDVENKRNGYRQRTFGVKGLGMVTVRVPRDRKGTFESRVVPSCCRARWIRENGPEADRLDDGKGARVVR